jgi:hypothetical protein
MGERLPNVAHSSGGALSPKEPGLSMMTRNASVYARGTVRHSDHETITLSFWHRVLMNTETKTRTMAKVAFLD